MNLLVQHVDVSNRGALLHKNDARILGVLDGDRIRIVNHTNGKSESVVIDTTPSLVEEGHIGVYSLTFSGIGLEDGHEAEVFESIPPASIRTIRKKMDGGRLSKDEIYEVVSDIVLENISLTELTAFVTASYIHGLDMDEVEYLTRAMVDTGDSLEFSTKPVVDKHSIGGVPGNKITLIIVPILAAAGLKVPKTSSRAITGAGGTADLMEVLAPVEFSAIEVQEMTEKAGAVIVWGGSTNIAPADDRIINVEYPLKIDARGQMIASVIAKKKAAGADIVVIDIPVGKEAKVESLQEARKLAREFIEIGERLDLEVECAITFGDLPVGRTIGPNLEVAEAMRVLEGSPSPGSLVQKSLAIAGIALEMAGKAARGEGEPVAREILQSGAALAKMKEIIAIQGGNADIKADDLKPGIYMADVPAPADGYVINIANRALITIARLAGAPNDKGAGIWLHAKRGSQVKKGDAIMTIYADNEQKLKNALEEGRRLMPILVEGMLIDRLPSDTLHFNRMD
ncbi:thymidine phosphorylase [Methanomicrobiaceae archaeon CYW5]|uniref:AMP phosphorylase n=1 Tax=Methanovulcanius yangii TaxID=1789227 RepID=UPI0029C9C92C|nr:AMP phosphorylase [Methanovulcanius yangii]MBT8508039.1 thymidine phosphorylase [Methanovulcanius yangii]